MELCNYKFHKWLDSFCEYIGEIEINIGLRKYHPLKYEGVTITCESRLCDAIRATRDGDLFKFKVWDVDDECDRELKDIDFYLSQKEEVEYINNKYVGTMAKPYRDYTNTLFLRVLENSKIVVEIKDLELLLDVNECNNVSGRLVDQLLEVKDYYKIEYVEITDFDRDKDIHLIYNNKNCKLYLVCIKVEYNNCVNRYVAVLKDVDNTLDCRYHYDSKERQWFAGYPTNCENNTTKIFLEFIRGLNLKILRGVD